MSKTASNQKLEGKLPMRAKLGYGTIGLSYIAQTMMLTWQMYFFTTFAGVDVGVAGSFVAIGRTVAAFIAPVWGYISDRLYQTGFGRKIGRRRGVLLLTIPGITLFNITQFIIGLPVWAYAASVFLYWAFFAGLTTVQYGLPAEMANNSSQRAQLVGINQITTAIASIVYSMLNTYLFTVMGDSDPSVYTMMTVLYAIFGAAILVFGFFTIQEREYDSTTDLSDADKTEGEKVPLLKRISLIVWNYVSALSVKEYRNYLGMYLCQNMFRAVRGSTLTYFLVFVLGLTSAMVSISQGFSFIFGIALVGFFMWLNSKIGGTKAFRIGSIEAVFVFLAMFALALVHEQIGQAATVTAWIILALALNFGITGVVNATDYAYTFIPDVDEVLTGKRREGTYASINSTIDDIFMSLEAIVITNVLAAGGFVTGSEVQPDSVVTMLTYVFCFVPIFFFCFLGLVFSFRVKLDDKKHDQLMEEVERLRAGGRKEDVTPEAKQLVEELTGWDYDKCWGNNNVINYSHKASK